MAAHWSAVVNTTAHEILKGASDLTLRSRVILALALRRKRVKYNGSGDEHQEQVKFALPEMKPYSGGPLDFAPADKYRKLLLPWRSYYVTDQMTKMEKLMNSGPPQLVNRYANIMRDNRQSLEDGFGPEMYVDGYTYTTRLCGFESAMAEEAGTTADDLIAKPSDTYAGRSTIPGGEEGTWSTDLETPPNAALATDWPSGSGSSQYDYLSPRLLNTSSTGWTGQTTWLENCERVIRRGVIWGTLTGGRNGKPDLCMLDGDMYYDYQTKQEPKARIEITPTQEVRELGFEGLKQEGVSVVTEFGVPAGCGYLINVDQFTLQSMQGQLFDADGPHWDPDKQSWIFVMGFYGQMSFKPKFFAKMHAYG